MAKKAAKKTAKKGGKLSIVRSKNATAQWQKRFNTDAEVREHFLSVDHNLGLQDLQDMRRQVDIAARSYDENIQRNSEERCANNECRRKLGPNQPWYNRQPVKNLDTGQTHNVFTCSLACFVIVHGKDGKEHQGAPRSH